MKYRTVLLILCLQFVGCTTLLRKPLPATQTERLMAVFRDLESGRFLVVADFEQARHLGLFRLEGDTGPGELSHGLTGGLPDTGGQCLVVRFEDNDDVLVAADDESREWFLKRDWRDYNLLLMNVHAPEDNVALSISIVSTVEDTDATAQTSFSLRAGWNTLRLDLHEIAAHVPLDTVREIRCSVPRTTQPVVLRFDDILLIDNRKDLFGSSTDVAGHLYVQRDGRHWSVGAGGRFELGFANGQILRWFDLESDPNRLNNLLGNSALGPTPIVLPPDPESGPDSADFSEFGDTVQTRQRILEMSPTRVVVECEWNFIDLPQENDHAPDPFQRWIYTIHPTGQVYVHTECTTEHEGRRLANVGLAVTRAGPDQLDVVTHGTAQLETIEDLRHVCFGYARPKTLDGAALLWVMHNGRVAPELEAFPDADKGRLTLLASGATTQYPVQSWDSLLSLWPRSLLFGNNPEERALDYCYPAALKPTVGRLVKDHPEDSGGDGFLERSGTYLLESENGRLRFVIEGSRVKRHWPTITILGPPDHNAWVYVDLMLISDHCRDETGNLTLQIPGIVEKDTLVEVYFSKDPHAAPASGASAIPVKKNAVEPR